MAKVNKVNKRIKRIKHIQKKVFGHTNRPRITVYRSNKHLYAQIVDDNSHKTIVAASDYEITTKGLKPVEKAEKIGESLAKKALEKNIKEVVFDRRGFRYHGKIKTLAEGARKGGLIF